jgi:hypothetical protein
MFTGKRPGESQATPTTLVKDLDPTIERVILRCLDADPRSRPSSALNVAMALPGGDPIAAALAAGETPSPEMVAASGDRAGLGRAGLCKCPGPRSPARGGILVRGVFPGHAAPHRGGGRLVAVRDPDVEARPRVALGGRTACVSG